MTTEPTDDSRIDDSDLNNDIDNESGTTESENCVCDNTREKNSIRCSKTGNKVATLYECKDCEREFIQ